MSGFLRVWRNSSHEHVGSLVSTSWQGSRASKTRSGHHRGGTCAAHSGTHSMMQIMQAAVHLDGMDGRIRQRPPGADLVVSGRRVQGGASAGQGKARRKTRRTFGLLCNGDRDSRTGKAPKHRMCASSVGRRSSLLHSTTTRTRPLWWLPRTTRTSRHAKRLQKPKAVRVPSTLQRAIQVRSCLLHSFVEGSPTLFQASV